MMPAWLSIMVVAAAVLLVEDGDARDVRHDDEQQAAE